MTAFALDRETRRPALQIVDSPAVNSEIIDLTQRIEDPTKLLFSPGFYHSQKIESDRMSEFYERRAARNSPDPILAAELIVKGIVKDVTRQAGVLRSRIKSVVFR